MLQRHDQGMAISALQDKLLMVGFISFDLKIRQNNGYFDLQTEAAVRMFQRRNGLTIDGLVGKHTEAVLNKVAAQSDNELLQDPISWITNTKYLTQRDNVYVPNGTCNVTSLAMVLDYWGVRGIPGVEGTQLEDQLFSMLQTVEAQAYYAKNFPQLKDQGYNPRNVHGMLGWLAQELGFIWKFSDNIPFTIMDEFGLIRGPMITSGAFTGSGHVVCIVGMTEDQDLIVHDPWGNWNKGYKNTNGKFVIYNIEDMRRVLSGNGPEHKRIHRIWIP